MTDQPYQIAPGHITTPWSDDVDPSNPLPEYPRPQMARDAWQNLNGLWHYAITPKKAAAPASFTGQILVPYPIESALSGVKRPLQPDETLWYQRTFKVDPEWQLGGRVLLHFGAVDWTCRLTLNGEPIGAHTGGYDPFTFDITDALLPGDNELLLAVEDPTDSQPIQRGKQVLKPSFIWYTAVSGIWQTVWLEHVPDAYLIRIKITPNLDDESVALIAFANQRHDGLKIQASVLADGQVIAKGESQPDQPIKLELPSPNLWSPDSPYLYDLEIQLMHDGKQVDHVKSYFGMRKFSLEKGEDGIPRFYLNNQPCFLYGPLDQGYWPDGLYTPPTDEAMRWEIQFLKDAGFNMLRKHIKVEPARYYYHCDHAGIIVWQDMISGGISPKPIWFVFAQMSPKMRDDRCYWRLGRGKAANRLQFRAEYERMLDTLHNVISIALWGPFNEGWGQFDAAEIAAWTQSYDPTRLVDHASGWFDQGAGHFKSQHVYFKPLPKPEPEKRRGWVLSEFGGYSLNIPDHAWHPDKDFGYKRFEDQSSLTAGYVDLIENQLLAWVRAGLSAAVYTQTADVETEVNGFLTYDRKVAKMDLDAIRKIHKKIFEAAKNTSR